MIGKKEQETRKRETSSSSIANCKTGLSKSQPKIYELSGGEAQRVALAKIILKILL